MVQKHILYFMLLFLLMVISALSFNINAKAEGVPNTFTSGTTAKSAEVNTNFEYVNYSNIVVKDGNRNEIGPLVDMRLKDEPTFEILNSNGYIMSVRWDNGEINDETHTFLDFSYTSTDCSGADYTYVWNHSPGSVLRRSSGELFYIDKNASKTTMTVNSYYSGGTCSSETFITDYEFYPLTANDPSITGVSSANFATPITIERR